MKRALVALLLLSSVAEAQTAAFRAGSGLQLNTIASRPTTIAGRRTLWIDTSNRLRFYNGTDDTYPSTIAATTKGDLSVFTGSTWGRLAAGTNDYCLVADSAQTTGLKWATCAAATGYQTIEDEGSGLTQRTILNFIGSGVSCVDNAGSTRTDCTISSGGSTGNWTFASDAADDSGANVLTIGATTATGVTLSRSAGTITMAGATVFGANKGITATAGTGAFDFSGGTGVFKTSTGASTFGGSSNTFSSGAIGPASGQQHTLPAVTSDTFALLGATQTLAAKTLTAPVINGATSSGSTSVDFSGNSGTFKTTTGANTFGGSTNSFTNQINAAKGLRVGTGYTIYPQSDLDADIGLAAGGAFRRLYIGDIIAAPAAATSGTHTALSITGASDTGLTAGVDSPTVGIYFGNLEHATGAITTARGVAIGTPMLSFVGASTITNAATLAIAGAPTAGANATMTNRYALMVESGDTYLAGASYLIGTANLRKTSIVSQPSSTPHTTLTVTGAADTTLTASAEEIDVDVALNRTVQHTAGAITTQRAALFRAPTYSFTSASTITTAATLAIDAAPTAGTSATITNPLALWVQDGASLFQRDSVGTTVGTAALTLENRTAATVGAQKYSPALIWSGRGWQTTGPASETVQMLAQVIPVQGTAHPTVGLSIQSQINGGSWVESLNIGSTGITASVPIAGNLGSATVTPNWTAITYSNSWVDFGASSTSRYSKNATGQVTLEIRCKNGSSATAAINSGTPIAAGYRPGQVTQICGQTLAGGIACGDLDTGGVFTPSVSSTSGIFLRAQYFAEN